LQFSLYWYSWLYRFRPPHAIRVSLLFSHQVPSSIPCPPFQVVLPQVRCYIAGMQYRFPGLRFPAVHRVFSSTERHILPQTHSNGKPSLFLFKNNPVVTCSLASVPPLQHSLKVRVLMNRNCIISGRFRRVCIPEPAKISIKTRFTNRFNYHPRDFHP